MSGRHDHITQKTTNDQPLRIALLGASGSMGREIERLVPSHRAEIVTRFDSGSPLGTEQPDEEIDVAIDFTLPDVVVGNAERLLEWGIPVVIGTTGWLGHRKSIEDLVRRNQGRLIWASNFSVGVQTFFRIVRDAARLMNDLEEYDVAIHEEHHIRKADSPSGTARSLAEIVIDAIDRKRSVLEETSHGQIDPTALHVTSARIGETIGTHRITFDSEADTIELNHRARNRGGFALGAIIAADWLRTAPPGFYRFDDYFEEIIRSRR